MIEYPKWVYRTDGPQESYPDGLAPVLVQSREEEDALTEAAAAQAFEDDAPAARRPNKLAK